MAYEDPEQEMFDNVQSLKLDKAKLEVELQASLSVPLDS
jgi:hypothetical protein